MVKGIEARILGRLYFPRVFLAIGCIEAAGGRALK